MKTKQPRRRRIWPLALAGLAILAVLAIFLVPQLLVRQATQKPAEVQTGTFVTRQLETQTLQERMQQALQNGSGDAGTSQLTQPGQNQMPGQTSEQNAELSAPRAEGAESGQQTSPDSGTVPDSGEADGQNLAEQPGDPAGQGTSAGQGTVRDPQTAPQNTSSQQTQTPDRPAAAPAEPPRNAAPDHRFRVQMSENEIAGMIYSGIHQGTAPEYRASIQGVSTRIQNGRARITVALLPRHLPEAFLKNLPGVSRSTPTVYLGGELSLRREGASVVPDIHELSLGNFRVPMPFIREAVRATVQQQADQMLRLPNGQQARLEEVQLQNGAMTLIGRVE